MTPSQKLRALLDSLGYGKQAEYGDVLRDKYRRKSGGQLLLKWAKDEGFSPANQALAAELFGLPADYFDDAPEETTSGRAGATQDAGVRYQSLRDFLAWRDSPFGAVRDDEVTWLASHSFAGDDDPGTLAWWSTMLQAYRGLMAAHVRHKGPPSRGGAPHKPSKPSAGARRRS